MKSSSDGQNADGTVPSSLEGLLGNQALLQMFQVLGELPKLLSQLDEQKRQIAILAKEVHHLETVLQSQSVDDDGWLDTPGAKEYLGVSRNTFDKYRYCKFSKVKLTGHKVGGKTLYKREELDRFVKLKQLDRS